MGKEKHLKKVIKLFKKSPVLSFSSIEKIVKEKKNIKQYTKQLIKNLINQGRIKKLTKGHYTIHEDPSLIVFCFKSAYLGLQDALSEHNLWEQEIVPVIITTDKVRQGIRRVIGSNVFIKRISSKYFFGFEYKEVGDFYFPYSDIEKTFIDMIYFKNYLDDELLKEFKERINKKKLNSYLKNYPKRFRKQVLNKIGESS